MKRKAMMTDADANTLLLLHGDDFLDSSMYDRKITNIGVTINANGKLGGCFYFNGSSYLSLSGIRLTDPFTFECFFKTNSLSGEQTILSFGEGSFQLRTKGNYIQILSEGVSELLNVCTILTSTWYHIAAVYASNKMSIYVNGILMGAYSYNFRKLNYDALIGVRRTGLVDGGLYEYLSNGYLDEIRVSAIARWTSNFTPPTKPY